VADGNEPGRPATEKRGGEAPDWDHARPGEELPERPGITGQVPSESPGREGH
jgi:hypothetical protein